MRARRIRSTQWITALLIGLFASVSLAETADREVERIYQNAVANRNEVDPPGLMPKLKALLRLNTVFDSRGRKTPKGKARLVHGGDKNKSAIGVLEFVPNKNNGLGGLLGRGGTVVARASSTIPFLSKKNMAPGISILRPGQQGRPDVTGFFLASIAGQGKNQDFFAPSSFSNDIRPRGSLKRVLGRALVEMLQLPIRAITWRPRTSPLGQSIMFIRADQLASDDPTVRNRNPVKRVELRPHADVQNKIAPGSKRSLSENVASVAAPGKRVFDVYADGRHVGHFRVKRAFVGTGYRHYVRHARGAPGRSLAR